MIDNIKMVMSELFLTTCTCIKFGNSGIKVLTYVLLMDTSTFEKSADPDQLAS